MKSKKNSILAILWIICLTAIFANDYIQPDYEIKLFLDDAKVLELDSMELQIQAKEYFMIQSQYAMGMQFLDSKAQELYNQGWLVRLRVKANKPLLEISYKYRIAVETTIQASLEKAKELGWDSSETGYDYQIDWGYEKQTLSITKEVENKTIASLPSIEKARDLSLNHIPGKLEKWGKRYLGIEQWAMGILKQSHLYGPVNGIRHTGSICLPTVGTIKIYIEIWDIAGTYITEISTKVSDFATAQKIHALLKAQLREKGWLLEKDVLKTKMVFSAYSN